MNKIKRHFNAASEALVFPAGVALMQVLTSFALEHEFKVGYVIGGAIVGIAINNFRLAYRVNYLTDENQNLFDINKRSKEAVENPNNIPAKKTLH